MRRMHHGWVNHKNSLCSLCTCMWMFSHHKINGELLLQAHICPKPAKSCICHDSMPCLPLNRACKICTSRFTKCCAACYEICTSTFTLRSPASASGNKSTSRDSFLNTAFERDIWQILNTSHLSKVHGSLHLPPNQSTQICASQNGSHLLHRKVPFVVEMRIGDKRHECVDSIELAGHAGEHLASSPNLDTRKMLMCSILQR